MTQHQGQRTFLVREGGRLPRISQDPESEAPFPEVYDELVIR